MSYHGGPSSSDFPHHHHHGHHSPLSSGAATPTTPTSAYAGSSSFLPGSFYSAFGSLMRRLSADPSAGAAADATSSRDLSTTSRSLDLSTHPPNQNYSHSRQPRVVVHHPSPRNNGIDGVYSPPFVRTVSPMRPPPLEPLVLSGFHDSTPKSARLLTSVIAEEIRIMVPERLRIEDEWKLVYSLDQDGASLATLYKKCSMYTEHRVGFVLAVRDQEGGTFGAYLSEYPHPSPHYFGTGECFLWRASLLAALPPPPSANTAQLTARSITLPAASPVPVPRPHLENEPEPLIPGLSATPSLVSISSAASSNTSAALSQPLRPLSSPSMRFSAFPYSGVNEYFMYCEGHSLSVGGGDGKYGLWLDDSLEKGVSSTCLTFGNQPLSDEGDKFGVLGVEVWVIGARR